jgi:hypothetical protein
MTELKRLVLDFRTGELVIRTLYRTEGEADPNTKARRREVTEISREGLSTALEALEGRVDVVGTSGFTTRTVPRRNVRPRAGPGPPRLALSRA